MSSKYQNEIIKDLKKKGFKVVKVVKFSADGYPDLIAMKKGECIFIEVKEENDSLKPLQKFRIDELIKNGFKAYCTQKNKGIIYGKD